MQNGEGGGKDGLVVVWLGVLWSGSLVGRKVNNQNTLNWTANPDRR